MKYYEITIKVDTNDADYNEKTTKISEDDLNKIRPLIAAIASFKPYETSDWRHAHNYPVGDCCRTDLGEKRPVEIYSDFDEEIHELFSDLCPRAEYGFHTINSIFVCPFVKKERLL